MAQRGKDSPTFRRIGFKGSVEPRSDVPESFKSRFDADCRFLTRVMQAHNDPPIPEGTIRKIAVELAIADIITNLSNIEMAWSDSSLESWIREQYRGSSFYVIGGKVVGLRVALKEANERIDEQEKVHRTHEEAEGCCDIGWMRSQRIDISQKLEEEEERFKRETQRFKTLVIAKYDFGWKPLELEALYLSNRARIEREDSETSSQIDAAREQRS